LNLVLLFLIFIEKNNRLDEWVTRERPYKMLSRMLGRHMLQGLKKREHVRIKEKKSKVDKKMT
jgi:hypothetical protein